MSHWMLRKSRRADDATPWRAWHTESPDDLHCARVTQHGAWCTFSEAAAGVAALSWRHCGLALDTVPFYGLELGVHVPGESRVCALDVAGFRHMEDAILYSAVLRGLTAVAAEHRADVDGYMVAPMDAEDADRARPLVGATVYRYDPEVGTTWSQDLLSWETHALTPAAAAA